jgi:hypothetical protein
LCNTKTRRPGRCARVLARTHSRLLPPGVCLHAGVRAEGWLALAHAAPLNANKAAGRTNRCAEPSVCAGSWAAVPYPSYASCARRYQRSHTACLPMLHAWPSLSRQYCPHVGCTHGGKRAFPHARCRAGLCRRACSWGPTRPSPLKLIGIDEGAMGTCLSHPPAWCCVSTGAGGTSTRSTRAPRRRATRGRRCGGSAAAAEQARPCSRAIVPSRGCHGFAGVASAKLSACSALVCHLCAGIKGGGSLGKAVCVRLNIYPS